MVSGLESFFGQVSSSYDAVTVESNNTVHAQQQFMNTSQASNIMYDG